MPHLIGIRGLDKYLLGHSAAAPTSKQQVTIAAGIADIMTWLKNKRRRRYLTLHFNEKSAPVGALFVVQAAVYTAWNKQPSRCVR
ncbi:hypothetical protein [Aeromonas eucrenophila]|uniref:Transposase n=1 Tax=Aeromonas eucrenophila TaxID=649 RepID=A0ABW0YCI0_9GAMM|nr:hypothetical protein [Aeromonas eucrenophila]